MDLMGTNTGPPPLVTYMLQKVYIYVYRLHNNSSVCPSTSPVFGAFSQSGQSGQTGSGTRAYANCVIHRIGNTGHSILQDIQEFSIKYPCPRLNDMLFIPRPWINECDNLTYIIKTRTKSCWPYVWTVKPPSTVII